MSIVLSLCVVMKDNFSTIDVPSARVKAGPYRSQKQKQNPAFVLFLHFSTFLESDNLVELVDRRLFVVTVGPAA